MMGLIDFICVSVVTEDQLLDFFSSIFSVVEVRCLFSVVLLLGWCRMG